MFQFVANTYVYEHMWTWQPLYCDDNTLQDCNALWKIHAVHVCWHTWWFKVTIVIIIINTLILFSAQKQML